MEDQWTIGKKVGSILIHFYENMKKLDCIPDYQEREGKKATRLIMAINEIEELFSKQVARDAEDLAKKWIAGGFDDSKKVDTKYGKLNLEFTSSIDIEVKSPWPVDKKTINPGCE